MIELFLRTDKQSYEKDQISKWLRTNKVSPVTRDILHMSMLCEDHTMAKIIKSLNSFHINESLIDNIGTASPPTVVTRTASTTTTVETIPPPTISINDLPTLPTIVSLTVSSVASNTLPNVSEGILLKKGTY